MCRGRVSPSRSGSRFGASLFNDRLYAAHLHRASSGTHRALRTADSSAHRDDGVRRLRLGGKPAGGCWLDCAS
jgi:hypothetical protein